MILTHTITKKILEKIIHESFAKFGNVYTSALLDSLKNLGFHYATNAGVSINIEDLKTPDTKKEILEKTEAFIETISKKWYQGKLSDTERFQSIIDEWNLTTEKLKDKIIDYYREFDPANNLYIMAFSGARGNISQVRQLVGMRGLMADQEGNIIDLPIQNNFREGLSSIDYLISSYGARKGIVDTALKTADSGYLTRRLIYVAQDLVIRDADCKTGKGLLICLQRNMSAQNLVGKYFLTALTEKNERVFKEFENSFLNEQKAEQLEKHSPLRVKIRSVLTCGSLSSLCQKCYGWDLSTRQMVSLGQTVGIIAAQSIGEPGTQLTMRTFHTGGIFTSELLDQKIAPFSGKLSFPTSFKVMNCRSSQGLNLKKLLQETKVKVTSWEGEEKLLSMPYGSLLYKDKAGFIKKGELISESARISGLGKKRLKALYSPMDGELKMENIHVRKARNSDNGRLEKVNSDDGKFWIFSGKTFSFPKESLFKITNLLQKQKSLAKIKLICPFDGLVKISNNQVQILQKRKKAEINFEKLTLRQCNNLHLTIQINSFLKNNQLIEAFNLIACIYFLPKKNERLFKLKKLQSKKLYNFFLITESDIYKLYIDDFSGKSLNLVKNQIVLANTQLSRKAISKESGRLLEQNGSEFLFQRCQALFLRRGSLLQHSLGNFTYKGQLLAYLMNYKQQTEDIVQGLPKIDNLIEARSIKKSRKLSSSPYFVLTIKNLKNLHIFKREDIEKNKKGVEYFSYFLTKEKLHKNDREKRSLVETKTINNITLIDGENINISLMKKGRGPLNIKPNLKHFNFVELFESCLEGPLDLHELLRALFFYYEERMGTVAATYKAQNALQLMLLNSIQAVYQSQGVDISNKHIEIIVRQMLSKGKVTSLSQPVDVFRDASIPFLKGEIVKLPILVEIFKLSPRYADPVLAKIHNLTFEPICLSSTMFSLKKEGFLTPAGFQETKRTLIRASLEGNRDWLRGLKDCIITGRVIPAGTAFLSSKNYLDTIYLYKKSKTKENLKPTQNIVEEDLTTEETILPEKENQT